MNDTKWREIFEAFYYGVELAGGPGIFWTTKDLQGHEYQDSTWTHFGCSMESNREIDWLRIDLTPQNRELVLDILTRIHVPGEIVGNAVYVYGYRTDVDYIKG